MTNLLPIIAESILNIELYSYFKIKCNEKKYPKNQTYYLGYDGIHKKTDEINIDIELLHDLITGKAEIVPINKKNTIKHTTGIYNMQIHAISNRWRLGNLNILEWKFIYYIIAIYTNAEYKKSTQNIDFDIFTNLYNYNYNFITQIKRTIKSLENKGIISHVGIYKNKKIDISIKEKILNSIQKTNYTYNIKYISNFKNKHTYAFFDYIIYKLKKGNYKILQMTIAQLKEICSVTDNYKRFIDIENSILKPMLNDINKIKGDNNYKINITYKKIKISKKIEEIKFIIIRREE